jgi:glucose/mannose transport system substrate-binding protein
LTWTEAAEMVAKGKAAMTIAGDWAKGFLINQGMRPDIELGELAPPGTNGTFVYIANTFGLPKGCANREGAANFLKVVGSIEGQDVFNPIMGSIPPRTDSDVSRYDPLSKKTIEDFQTNKLAPAYSIISNYEFGLELDMAMEQFATDRNVDDVVRFLRNHYDMLRNKQ